MIEINKEEVRELLISKGFKEIAYNSGIYDIAEYRVHFPQNDWGAKNWLTIERIQVNLNKNRNAFIKFNNHINSIEDLKFLLKLIINI